MEIAKIESNIKKIVLNTVVPFKQLHMQKKIRDGISDIEKNEILGIINFHLVSVGINKKLDEVSKIEISQYLKLKCKDLSIQDIKLALENERFGEWEKTNHFQLFNIVYFSDIIKKYREWKLKKYRDLNLSLTITEEKKPSKSELDKIENDYLKVIYDELKNNGYTNRLTNDIYNNLEEKGKFKMPKKERWILFEKVKKKYINELKSKGLNSSPYDRTKIKKLLENNRSLDSEVKHRCKCILFSEFCKGKLESFEGFKNEII